MNPKQIENPHPAPSPLKGEGWGEGVRAPTVPESLASAAAGLRYYARRSRRNLVITSLCGLAALGGALALKLDELRAGLIILTSALVISLEVLNTAIESLLDALQPGFSAAVKRAKDLTAAAVLIAAIGAIALGLLLFWEPLGLPGFDILRFFVLAGLAICLLGILLRSFIQAEAKEPYERSS